MRTLLFILLPFLASGQIYVDSYKFGAPATELLLDAYGGAAAAFSLRLLDSDYTGDCITVRRASDNALDTFGFVNNYLDTTSLKTFCGTGATDTCWVRIWFDQSGNARNAKQDTAVQQPIILLSGNLFRINNNVALRFDATNDNFTHGSFSGTHHSSFGVWKVNNYTSIHNFYSARIKTNFTSFGYASLTNNVANTIVNQTRTGSAINVSSHTDGTSNQLLNSFIHVNSGAGASSQTVWLNGTQKVQTTNINPISYDTSNIYYIGYERAVSSFPMDGAIQELVIYTSNESSNRTGIESNINAFYSIY